MMHTADAKLRRTFKKLAAAYRAARAERVPVPFNLLEISDAAAKLLERTPGHMRASLRKAMGRIVGSAGTLTDLLQLQRLAPEVRALLDPSRVPHLSMTDALLVARKQRDIQPKAAENLLRGSRRYRRAASQA